MIVVTSSDLRRIVDLCEAAYPREACGLLVGHDDSGDAEPTVTVSRVEPSANVAEGDNRSHFEVDPALRLRLQKDLRGGPERVIGLYHSHPNSGAQPSSTDLDAAWEPDLVWLVTSVIGGQAVHTSAHVLVTEGGTMRFSQVALRTSDWRPYESRAALAGPGLS